MDDEEAILDEVMETLREATQRLRSTKNRLWATGMEDRTNYRDLAHRVSSALAMTKHQEEGAKTNIVVSRQWHPLFHSATGGRESAVVCSPHSEFPITCTGDIVATRDFCSKNVNPKIVQEMMGHATISQSMDTYSHVVSEMSDVAAKAIESALS